MSVFRKRAVLERIKVTNFMNFSDYLVVKDSNR